MFSCIVQSSLLFAITHNSFSSCASRPPTGQCLFPFPCISPSLCLFCIRVLSKYCCSLIPLFSGLPSGPISSDAKCRGERKLRLREREKSRCTDKPDPALNEGKHGMSRGRKKKGWICRSRAGAFRTVGRCTGRCGGDKRPAEGNK